LRSPCCSASPWPRPAAGALIGGLIGNNNGSAVAGVLIGAAIGGAAGAGIGRYMDKQAAELQRDLENARVERVGEGIKITFNSGILFDTDSESLRPAAKTNLSDLSTTLQKYSDTKVLVQGHTDSTGADQHNARLSELRALSVARQLKAQGVEGGRIDTEGLGEAAPVTTNDSEAGRQANRRVEVAIYANDKLKKAAEQGRL